MTLNQLYQALTQRIPSSLSESWDNDGVMLCADREKTIKRALVMLDVTTEGVAKAVSENYDVIITHHPFVFHPLKSVTDDFARTARTLLENNIPVLSFHTRLDAVHGGVNDSLAKAVGLSEISPFGGESSQLGRVGILPQPVKKTDFIAHLQAALGCSGIRFSAKSKDTIRKVAVLGGGGKSFYADAALAGADAYVTSEISHDVYYAAEKYGLLLCDCGHYFTENVVCGSLAALIKEVSENAVQADVFAGQCPYGEI